MAQRNSLVDLCRALAITRGTKQTGRKYGPPPKNKPSGETPEPMPTSRRVAVYQRQNGRLLGMTRRQLRQVNRKSLAHARRAVSQ